MGILWCEGKVWGVIRNGCKRFFNKMGIKKEIGLGRKDLFVTGELG